MREIKITWFDRFKRVFRNKLKPFLVDGKYKVIPAFELNSVDYFMFESTNEVPTGRFFAAMGIYQEMEMNCDKEYLTSHIKAMEKVLSNPKSIRIDYIMQMNINLKERLELMPFPDFIYKLASVIFFDKTESMYGYDWEYNKLKIERWKAAGGTLDFFSRTPLKELVPQLTWPDKDIQTYSTVSSMVAEVHRRLLTDTLSGKE